MPQVYLEPLPTVSIGHFGAGLHKQGGLEESKALMESKWSAEIYEGQGL
jgi:hypothetical protein